MHRFEELQAFVAVVESGSFTAAAERLGLAKSALSRRVSALEDRLGVQLLQRTTRRLNLTDTGRGFYERSARILADLDEAEAAVLQEHGELRGTLRVAIPMSFGVLHMGAPIAEFSQRHPRVMFDLDLNDRRVDLLQEGADLAIRIGRLADSTLIAQPEELAAHDCLGYSNAPETGRWMFHDPGGTQGSVDIRLALVASSGDFLCEAAVRGCGIVLLPTFIAGGRICTGELKPILTNYKWPTSPAYAVYPPTRHLSYRVRAFIDFLAQRFAGVPSWDADCGLPARTRPVVT